MKLRVATGGGLRKKEKQGELNLTQKIHGFLNPPPPPPPPLNAHVFSLEVFFFFNFTLFMTKLKVLVLCFPNFKDKSTICP